MFTADRSFECTTKLSEPTLSNSILLFATHISILGVSSAKERARVVNSETSERGLIKEM